MTSQEITFLILGAIGSVAAFRLVTSKNVIHAALYLVVTLAMVASTYLVLESEFIAWVQVLIYVGAIVVLLLFGLMLTKAPIGREFLDNQQRGIAALVGVGVLAGLVFLIQDQFKGKRVALDALGVYIGQSTRCSIPSPRQVCGLNAASVATKSGLPKPLRTHPSKSEATAARYSF